MDIQSNTQFVWLLAVFAFCLGVMIVLWSQSRFGGRKKSKLNQDYFKGLNFLLNEETDKAIDSFIKALEVDNDTVELHLALGGLFRRKGQVDRATRLHQNLIARPNLTERQRYEAIYELAQDYFKAGWLDRAEGLFDELKASPTYHAAAINGLCSIYHREKEWQQAIDVLSEHKGSERANYASQISHYYCEMAETAIENLDYASAKTHLTFATKEVKNNTRAILLKGELAFQQEQYQSALECWQSLDRTNEVLLQLVSGKIIRCFERLDDQDGLSRFLDSFDVIPRHGHDFKIWYNALVDLYGEPQAQTHILKRVEVQGLSGPVANHLFSAVNSHAVSDTSMSTLLKELLNRAKSKKIEYTCSGCGFDTKAMYWYCPNCGEWESFR